VLSGLCSELDASLDAAVAPALALTRFAVALRYPGESEEPSIEEVRWWSRGQCSTLFAHDCPEKLTPDSDGHQEW